MGREDNYNSEWHEEEKVVNKNAPEKKKWIDVVGDNNEDSIIDKVDASLIKNNKVEQDKIGGWLPDEREVSNIDHPETFSGVLAKQQADKLESKINRFNSKKDFINEDPSIAKIEAKLKQAYGKNEDKATYSKDSHKIHGQPGKDNLKTASDSKIQRNKRGFTRRFLDSFFG